MKKKFLSGDFCSYWEEGVVVTDAVLNLETGEVTAKTKDVPDMGSLKKEEFVALDDTTYPVCPVCHEYILRTVMKEGVGKTLAEVDECSNKDCDYNKD